MAARKYILEETEKSRTRHRYPCSILMKKARNSLGNRSACAPSSINFCRFPAHPPFFTKTSKSIIPARHGPGSPPSLRRKTTSIFTKSCIPYNEPPLFWIHLNVDYPFNLTGILFFPQNQNNPTKYRKTRYSCTANQVFVTDEVKDIVARVPDVIAGG